jgi:hypothetical protein
MMTMIVGSLIALVAAGAATALTAWTLPSIVRHDREAGYSVMLLAPGAFILGLIVVFGLYVALEGRRLTTRPKPPPSAPPPG